MTLGVPAGYPAAQCTDAYCALRANVTYAYDALGNLTRKTDLADEYKYDHTHNAGPHAVTRLIKGGVTLTTYTYDKNGNQLTGLGRTLSYTSFNLPRLMQKGANSTTYVYGPDHERVMSITNGENQIYVSSRFEVKLSTLIPI